jgi:cation diffusion facilitator CzcD-associated flavoprotein CzcO
VLEAATTVGGTWAEHRLYPGVKTNNLYGTYEFSDFPMDESTFEVGPGQHISGTVLHKYLDAYARKFDLLSRTRFNSCVTTIEQKEDSSWLLTVNVKRDDASGPCQYNLIARKLIIATGLTSEPRIPSFSGASSFQAPVVHSKNLPDYLKKLEEVKTVVVLGATKSGFDAVYEFASRNIHVHWVIRESGNGPVWILPPYVTRLKIQLEKLTQTRFITWLSPCIWGEADGYSTIRGYLHKTSIGRWFVDCYWRVMESYLLRLNRYDRCSETLKLKPWTKVFCTGTSQSILNYSTDFFELVRSGKVTVHISDITHLSQKTVHLADESVKADALICATGWKHLPQIKFLPEGLEADLGLPSPHTRAEDQESLAEKEIFESFPSLRSLSSPNSFRSRRTPADQRGLDATTRDTTHQPLRLYRFMVPPAFASQHNIGFAGMLMTINTMTSAEVQALWLCVYLSKGLGGLSTLPLKDLKWETMLHTQFCKLRYPQGFGHTFPDFLIDGLPYIDLLLRDLELPYRRKNGRLRELFEPYGPKDYKGLVEDWLYTTKLPHISCTMVERFPPNTLALSQSKKPKVVTTLGSVISTTSYHGVNS